MYNIVFLITLKKNHFFYLSLRKYFLRYQVSTTNFTNFHQSISGNLYFQPPKNMNEDEFFCLSGIKKKSIL